MFHNYANPATFAGEKTPENVPKNQPIQQQTPENHPENVPQKPTLALYALATPLSSM